MPPNVNPSRLIPGLDHPQTSGEQQEKQGIASDSPCKAFIAFALIPLGGWFGLHHLYLRRPIQAGLWACSPCFCFFNLSLLRDAISIPSYVEASNNTESEQARLEVEMKYSKVPPWRFSRILGCYFFGAWFAWCGFSWGPSFAPLLWFQVTRAVAGALGIWLAGCACTHQIGDLKATLAGCAAGACLGDYMISAAGIAGFQWSRQWQPEATKKRLAWWKVALLVCLFWFCTVLGFVEHASITAKVHGEDRTFGLKDCIFNVLRGISWKDFRNFDGNGEDSEKWDWSRFDWEKIFSSVSSRLDVAGEKRALNTLGMSDFVGKKYTAEDVKKHYRAAAKKWHPDHVAQADKAEAESKMQEINAAKEVLDKILP